MNTKVQQNIKCLWNLVLKGDENNDEYEHVNETSRIHNGRAHRL